MSDFGSTISLDLVYDYAGEPREESTIEFSDVAAYHFVHTGAAILNHIGEEAIGTFLQRFGRNLSEWWRLHGGYQLWDNNPDKYRANLEREGYRAWIIDSAVGFEGFVVAKAMVSRGPNPQVGANGRQPVSSDTNSTSSAAASSRSP